MNQSFWGLQALIILVVVAGFAVANMKLTDLTSKQYLSLKKPRWHPPTTVFRPIWFLLDFFLLLSINFAYIQTYGSFRFWLMVLYLNNCGLRLLWSVLFFQRHEVKAAAVELSVLWIATLALISLAAMHTTVGASLMVPYFIWVSFEVLINWSIVRQPANEEQMP